MCGRQKSSKCSSPDAYDRLINPLQGTFLAKNKPFQLKQASAVGLKTPDTVVTNEPDSARDFFYAHESGTIFKTLTPMSGQFTDTRELTTEHISQLSKLSYGPAIFQEKIKYRLDLRVTVIDDQLFAASTKITNPLAAIDTRLDVTAPVKSYKLPDTICDAIFKLMKLMSLRYGAIDMRLTPEDEYVFFEVNSGGQFLFVEIQTGQPISQALASSLLIAANGSLIN